MSSLLLWPRLRSFLSGMSHLIHSTYGKIIKGSFNLKEIEEYNFVKDIYAPFTVDEINDKIVELLKPKN